MCSLPMKQRSPGRHASEIRNLVKEMNGPSRVVPIIAVKMPLKQEGHNNANNQLKQMLELIQAGHLSNVVALLASNGVAEANEAIAKTVGAMCGPLFNDPPPDPVDWLQGIHREEHICLPQTLNTVLATCTHGITHNIILWTYGHFKLITGDGK